MVNDSFYNHSFTCSAIVSDDNSTMKSNLKHSWKEMIEAGTMKQSEQPKSENNFPKKDNDHLPLDMPEPMFLSDFNRRVKTIGKAVYGLAVIPKKDSTVTKDVAARIKNYWGTMLKQIGYLDWEKESEKKKGKVLAPIEHLFKDHTYCNQ